MASIEPYDTASGRRYAVRYRKPDHTQGRKRGFKTKRAAELFVAAIEVKKATGEFIDPTASRITVGELGRDWIKTQTHLKPSTFRVVESAWRVHVEPKWGKHAVGGIRHTAVQAWVSEVAAGDVVNEETGERQPRSATSVSRAYGVLAAILDGAVRDRRIPANPARGVKLPRKVKRERHYLTHEQVGALAALCGQHSTMVTFLAYTGLRWGEATGLRISDVDMLKRRLTVQRNAVDVGGHIVIGTPKTHEARTVPFPEFLELPIARLCQRDGAPRPRGELLFGEGLVPLRATAARDGWYYNAVTRAHEADANFPARFTIHDLRHTAASLAISAGANVKAVQRMLGHASAAMTLDTYADLFDDDLDAVASRLNAARNNSAVPKMRPKTASGE